MAITKSKIVSVLNARLKRTETTVSIADAITGALRNLSRLADWPDLHTTETQALTAGQESDTTPTDYRKLDLVYINDGTDDGEPLEEISYDEFRQMRAGEGISDQGEPERFALRGRKFYWHPVPDSVKTYTAKIGHWQTHPDQAAVLFADEFSEAVYAMTMLMYLRGKGLWVDPKTNAINMAAYQEIAGIRLEQDKKALLTAQLVLQDELMRMLGTADLKASVGKYNDIA